MPIITDKSHVEKLNKYNINIKTKYIVGNKILEKNTDGSINDEINNGIICEKKYYVANTLKHTEKLFDSRMEYTYILDVKNENITCPNCGINLNYIDFIDGCPYCGTYYNIDYTEKNLGGKFHYDRVIRTNTYRIITGIVDIIISIILSYFFIKMTSRTFNNYDISKIFIYGAILALILYYFFYIIDAYIILGPIKKYKDAQNKKQIDFWNNMNIDKITFFNSVNNELKNYLFSQNNIIDYDIIDYDEFSSFKDKDELYIKAKICIRIVKYMNNKIKSDINVIEYTFKKNNDILKINGGENIIQCSSCGSSIDVTKKECAYCNKKIASLNEWKLVK